MAEMCNFAEERLDDGRYRYRCRNEGCTNSLVWAVRLPKLYARCETSQRPIPSPPSAMRRLGNFSQAAIAHFMAGSPTCTQEQIDARLAICRTCRLFLPDDKNLEVGVCTHRECGCRLSRQVRYLNKLAWADQGCPLGLWLPIEAAVHS